jgi:hypothetical protein
MKNLTTLLLLFVAASLLVSCGNMKKKIEDSVNEAIEEVAKDLEESFTTFSTVEINDLYALDVPGFLVETNSLNDEASLQYENTTEEFYVIVIDENKDAFLEAINFDLTEDEVFLEEEVLDPYAYLQFTTFATDEEYDGYKDVEINGLNAKQLEIYNDFDSYKVYYKMACIEGEDNLYFVVIWTLADFEDEHEENMQKIIDSFKEI